MSQPLFSVYQKRTSLALNASKIEHTLVVLCSTNLIRHIKSSDPSVTAKDFYDRIAHGGIENDILDKSGNKKGATTKMADGTVVTWREVSSSDGSPAVDINIKKSVIPED